MRWFSRPICAVVSFVFVPGFVLAQTGTGGSRAGTASNVPSQSSPGASTGQLPQTTFVRGRVVTDDGSALPSPAVIVSVCGGNTHREVMTKSDGSFLFQLGDRSSSVAQDASNSDRPIDTYSGRNSGMTSNYPSASQSQFDTRTLLSCELRAELPGYDSSHVQMTGVPSPNFDVGILVLHSRGKKGEEGVVSVTGLRAPANARKEYEKAHVQLDKGKVEDAEASLRKAVEDYPQYAEAWFLLGKLQMLAKDQAGARSSFEEAVKSDSSYPPPYFQLVQMSANAHQWEDTMRLSERLLALNAARYPMAYYYNAVANYNLDHLLVAEANALKLEALDTQHKEPRVEILLALISTVKQNYSAAAQHYRTYLQLVPDGPLTSQVKADLAKSEEMAKAGSGPDNPSKP